MGKSTKARLEAIEQSLDVLFEVDGPYALNVVVSHEIRDTRSDDEHEIKAGLLVRKREDSRWINCDEQAAQAIIVSDFDIRDAEGNPNDVIVQVELIPPHRRANG